MDLLLTVKKKILRKYHSLKTCFGLSAVTSRGRQRASRSWVSRNPSARLQRPKVAMAPLRAWRCSGVLAIVVWAGATSLV